MPASDIVDRKRLLVATSLVDEILETKLTAADAAFEANAKEALVNTVAIRLPGYGYEKYKHLEVKRIAQAMTNEEITNMVMACCWSKTVRSDLVEANSEHNFDTNAFIRFETEITSEDVTIGVSVVSAALPEINETTTFTERCLEYLYTTIYRDRFSQKEINVKIELARRIWSMRRPRRIDSPIPSLGVVEDSEFDVFD
jgi:hypothetical protein